MNHDPVTAVGLGVREGDLPSDKDKSKVLYYYVENTIWRRGRGCSGLLVGMERML